MQLTSEQQAIINSTGNIKINAVAGSGKTTTVIKYAKARPPDNRILYLAFNRSVKNEASEKFAAEGLHNVQIETAHSLAFKHVVFKNGYKVQPYGYKTHEIVDILGLKESGDKHTEYIIANHINKFITYFCNSNQRKIQDLNYLDVISDSKAIEFVSHFYRDIEYQTRLLLSKMDSGEIAITHDFYLKKFQLSRPKLNYDYILFDEGQDASHAMLEIVFRQNTTKVIVGDTHQQIYGWRHAVNSLEKVDFKTYHLSTSFRFSQDIANLATEILQWKKHLGVQKGVSITGKGSATAYKTRAILARTNLGLLLKAIEFIEKEKKVRSIYFEGNIHSYTYADEGTSLYDVLNLHIGKRNLIRDKLIRTMKDLAELADYIEKTEDAQLGMMVEIVKKYGNEIPAIIKRLKEKHIKDDEKEKAEIIFSTVHRSKGMEYDTVQIVDDFITEEKLEKLNTVSKEEVNESKLNEEINLLYVAVTRARNSIYIPEILLPEKIAHSPRIHVIRTKTEDDSKASPVKPVNPSVRKPGRTRTPGDKSYTVAKVRKKHNNAYRPWTEKLDDELTLMYCEGVSVREMAKLFGRTSGAIRSRIKKLELRELYG